MRESKQTYKYKKSDSILSGKEDEYCLSKEQYCQLYMFYVTYSLCNGQSAKGKSFLDYGWPTNNIKGTSLGNALLNVLSLNKNLDFVFTDKDDLKTQFDAHDLTDGVIQNLENERAVIGKTPGNNNYLKLFYRVRNCLAHGKFTLRLSNESEKMVVMQDDDRYNVTARIVLKLSTILGFIRAIDKKSVI